MEKIYLNVRISESFQLPYTHNDGIETIIHTDALISTGVYDKAHLDFFNANNGDLKLIGVGVGWWKVQS